MSPQFQTNKENGNHLTENEQDDSSTLTENELQSQQFTLLDPIIIDDDSMDAQPTKENEAREEVCSNDSSGIVLSDRNEGSSLSSHAEEEPMQEVPNLPELPVEKKMPILVAHTQSATKDKPLSRKGRPRKSQQRTLQVKVKIERSKIPNIKIEKTASLSPELIEPTPHEDQLNMPLRSDSSEGCIGFRKADMYECGLWEYVLKSPADSAHYGLEFYQSSATQPPSPASQSGETTQRSTRERRIVDYVYKINVPKNKVLPTDPPTTSNPKPRSKKQFKPKIEMTLEGGATVVNCLEDEPIVPPIAKRGRGRPRKAKFEAAEARAVVVVEPKKRGRKRKAEIEANVAIEESFAAPKPKRQKKVKGQPPKAKVAATPTITKLIKPEQVQKCAVFVNDRISAIQANTSTAQVTVKRSRGRPKKSENIVAFKPERPERATIQVVRSLAYQPEQSADNHIFPRPEIQGPIHNHFRPSMIESRITYWNKGASQSSSRTGA